MILLVDVVQLSVLEGRLDPFIQLCKQLRLVFAHANGQIEDADGDLRLECLRRILVVYLDEFKLQAPVLRKELCGFDMSEPGVGRPPCGKRGAYGRCCRR